MIRQDTLTAYIGQALRDNWESLALTDFQGASFQFRDVARKIAKLHLLFENCGLRRGDKSLFADAIPHNGQLPLLASLTYGAVAVPILHDFKADTIHHLVNHSEARLFFVDNSTWENLDQESMRLLEGDYPYKRLFSAVLAE